ncbi:hypothetical protein L1987_45126 [Smallanthus sonchifolius]|uniref:Uncharacterized protein n=1 Tax=Smallanthus sonchifolius TaxID=185202 RepID=A0ACB9GR79_9ASTR|nr:hypothetical protein L1987_45126 [Smallanthus sonchifolius]
MASSFNKRSKPSTTFVQTDPSNFRAIVQKLTGPTTLQQPFTSTGDGCEMVLDVCGRSPAGTPTEEEEKAIAEKRFYLHPSPVTESKSKPKPEPELLVLFPLNSPKSNLH